MNFNSKIITGGLSQGLPSLLTLISSLWLMWQTSLAEFGLFSLLFAIVRMFVAVQAPLVTMPMNVLAKKRISADHYADFFTFQSVIFGVFFVASVFISWFFFPSNPIAQLAFVLYLLAQVLREFIKSYLFSTHNVDVALRLELYGATVFVISLITGHLLFEPSIQQVFYAGGISGLVALMFTVRSWRALSMARRRSFRWRRYLYIWKISKWSLAGALSNEVVARSYNYLVALFGGYELLGLINFARQLFSPLQLLSSSWMQIGIPIMRDNYVNSNLVEVLKIRRYSQVFMGVGTLLWTVLLWWSLPFIDLIFSKGGLSSLGGLVLLWGAYFFVDFQLIIYRIEIQVLLWFRWLFFTELMVAVITLLLAPLVLMMGTPTSLIALGLSLNVLLGLIYYRRFLDTSHVSVCV